MVRYLPSLKALRAFEAAAHHLSFTKGAEDLNVTQGAVSHQVKSLELQLGVKLFHRLHQGLTLTQSGQAYLPVVRDAFDRLAAGTELLLDHESAGVLTVSVSPNFASKWLVHRLGDFITRHPEIDLRIRASMGHTDFAREDVDMAIRHGDGHWPDLDVARLAAEEVFPVCSPTLMDGPTPLRIPADLCHHVLLHDLSRGGWPAWLTAAGVGDIDSTRGPVFNQTSMVIDAAVEGQGVALARSVLATADLLSGRLVQPFDVTIPADFAYYIVCPKIPAERPKISTFRTWLLNEAEIERQRLGALGERSD
ncbi:MAG: transcriptional regulator GcvA [Rhodospirillales bacterium]|nr:transcriptional regulator GcvA [Rhodospirillales bacterium]